MRCANPACKAPAFDLSAGVLRLVELDVPPEERVIRSDGGFPVCSVPSRYFWLCPACSSFLRISRWTPQGLAFEYISAVTAGKTSSRALSLQSSRVSLNLVRKSA